MWDQFLLAIDYKNSTLRDQKVNEISNQPFKASDVNKLDTNEEQLEQDLCSNLHALVTEGNSHEQFDYEDNDLATSSSFHFNEYGDLFFPEDITEPSVHTIHYPNTFSNRSAQDLRDTEPDPTPPRHRKSIQIKTEAKTETLKIRISPPAVVEEEEITLDDFQCLPTKNAAKERPKPRPKTQSDESEVEANTANINPSSYGTRSRSRAKEEEG
ncbi:hypothetical protein B0H13DRAFT_1893659 [Mycena leptocephala]|nr:hypothetical protein B0H13DRAFT_1893659 [Mycena leptocephala]